MTVDSIGHGAGKKNFPDQPNLLRLFVGEAAAPREPAGLESDRVWVLETNLDDLPAEIVGWCFERLLAAGALDVYSTPILMKKNRPGILLSILAPQNKAAELEAILFRETTTLGVRRYLADRHKLHREPYMVQTQWGPIQGKIAWRNGEAPAFAPEYEACARVARDRNLPLREVYQAAMLAAACSSSPAID
jgi:uncharacterized protein (DUF111 family)